MSDFLHALFGGWYAEPVPLIAAAAGVFLYDRGARRLVATWRLFLISTHQIWGYRGGNRWLVSHYLLEPHAG